MPFSGSAHQPLYEVKANLFKGLSHPLRIRVLEILTAAADSAGADTAAGADAAATDRNGGVPVSVLLADTGLEASHLSQHLSVLRRHHLVVAERRGSQVFYRPAYPQIADLLTVARVLLRQILQTTQDHIASTDSLPNVHPGAGSTRTQAGASNR